MANTVVGYTVVFLWARMWSPRQDTKVPPVWNSLVPLADTPGRRDQRIIAYHLKDTDNAG